jgi:hypothetical protein
MTDLIQFDFHGDRLLLVDEQGEPRIVLKPAIEALGLDYWAQIEKLKKRSWAALGSSRVQVPEQGQHREMLTATVRTFLMLLATIDENRVSKDVRSKLVAYQSEVADAIEAYWSKGGAINPRATEEQLAAVIDRAERQARVLTALSGIVDPAWLESKARHVAARALGEEPEDDLSRRPLTVGEYLEERGVAAGFIRKVSGNFGKALKKLYVARYGKAPGKVRRFVEGAHRDVAVYTEADRNLFDAVWSELRGVA